MTVSNPVTDNEIVIRLTAPEREAWKKEKEKDGLTYTESCFEVKEGKRKRIRVPAAAQKAKHISWCVVKLYTTAQRKAFLEADAERRGISVSKAIRADIFQPPKNPAPPVKAKFLRPTGAVSEDARAALAEVRARPEFADFDLMSEGAAFIAVASILLQREALSKP